uniref:Probable magnesium transporter n=1 Tax=Araucaria cunninghamii TaxID=56994 RepID=A0A0D6QXR1_ARACU
MGEWITGAVINLLGSIGINFGTNLLKLGHNQRERLAVEFGEKSDFKPIIYFQSWRIGLLIFALGNCLNFISFGYAAQSLLAALGSVQFISNIAFAYFVLKEKVTGRVLLATALIVSGNVFLVAFGNHQSPVYTPEQLLDKYTNRVFLLYYLGLVLIVAVNHSIYRKGELLLSISGKHNVKSYWHQLLPLSYAVVSGAIGSNSVLFAKSLSSFLRLSIGGNSHLHGWFTYLILVLFLCTAAFWMARLNDGLALFNAILIVPMFQIAWTFFSILTGFIYFQEYQVFNMLRTSMFLIGISLIFAGISLLAPDDSKGHEAKVPTPSDQESTPLMKNFNRSHEVPLEQRETKEGRTFMQNLLTNAGSFVGKAKTACTISLGLGQDQIHASSVLVMPMVPSRMTRLKVNAISPVKLYPVANPAWIEIITKDGGDTSDAGTLQQHG